VIDRFEQQLREGGPLLVDKGARRTFVHPWEAAQPMLQLIADGHDGGLFALTCGEEVEIDELADRLLLMNDLSSLDIPTEVRHMPRAQLSTALWGENEAPGTELFGDVVEIRQRVSLRDSLQGQYIRLRQAMDARDAAAIVGVLDEEAERAATA
jgi:FlaA1/EpsC-like NDP-sugar epimerase